MRVYLAGPLFTLAERLWQRQLAEALRARDLTVFLPQDDAGLPLLREPPDFHGAFEACRDAIDRADVVVATLDGADVDSGTAWECGYAYARNKPIVSIRTDFRGGEDRGMNLMLRRSSAHVVEQPSTDEDLEKLVEAVCESLADL